jgi:hypothetical protein
MEDHEGYSPQKLAVNIAPRITTLFNKVDNELKYTNYRYRYCNRTYPVFVRRKSSVPIFVSKDYFA